MELNGIKGGVVQNSTNPSYNADRQKTENVESTLEKIKAESIEKTKKDEPSKQDVLDIVDELNSDSILNEKLKFGFHDESSTFFVSVLDAKTDEVIRKYPSDEAMSLAARMRELSGALIDTQG